MRKLKIYEQITKCDYCQKNFINTKYRLNRSKNTFCSKTCHTKWMSNNNRYKNNSNFRHGRYTDKYKNNCINCGRQIDIRSKRCMRCRAIFNNVFKGKKHSRKSKNIIGLKSRTKFTTEFIERVYRRRFTGKKKRAINGYILIKDYKHPNRNSHNDVLEHIKVMSTYLQRPLKKGEIIHHINFIRNDNRLKNLYLYSSNSEHLQGSFSIFKLVKSLLEKNIICFEKGTYKMNSRLLKGSVNVQVGGKS